MIELGYKLCSEEQSPQQLVECAQQAEQTGFAFAMISDHFHPWIDRQGQASFVWTVLGALAQVTKQLRIGTAVTCPTMRIHPAIIAQAAATAAAMLPGRFILGLGSGENLNEHIFADHWPEAEVRHAMLEESVHVIRQLWQGGQQSHYGTFYTVENACIYTLPESLPPIMIAAGGRRSAALAARIGDGLIAAAPNKKVAEEFDAKGGQNKPRYAEMTVCWADDEKKARRIAFECWPNVALKGELTQILPVPAHFEQAVKTLREEDVAQEMVCGPDPAPYIEDLQSYERAGFSKVYIHQVGSDQAGFFRFCERELMPRLEQTSRKEKAQTPEAARPG